MNDTKISIKVPIKHFLKKYLSKKVDVSPFQLTNKGCHISAILLEPVEKGFYPKRETIPDGMDDYIEMELNTSIIKEGRFHLDSQIVVRMNSLLRDKFDDEFFHWVNSSRESWDLDGKAPEINECIESFMNYYDLSEDDIAFETLKKSYYRYRVPPRKPAVRPTKEQLQEQLSLWNFV